MRWQKHHYKWLSFGISLLLFIGFVSLLVKGPLLSLLTDKKSKMKPRQALIQNEQEESFQMLIKGRLAEVQECYNSQLRRGLHKSGNLVVRWTVDSQGLASNFEEELNELESTELYDCTTTAILSWPFPKNRPIHIRYTFKMRELEKEKIIREVSSLEE